MLGKGLCPVRNCMSRTTVYDWARASANQKSGFKVKILQDFYLSVILVFNDRKPSIVDVLVPPICITAQAYQFGRSRSSRWIRIRDTTFDGVSTS